MIDFEFHTPHTMDEVFSLLETHGDDARVMAGGTALVLQMKQRLAQPAPVISLQKVPGLNVIHDGASGVQLGALCTQAEIENAALVRQRTPLVADAFHRLATPRIRSVATIGGGLVHGDPNQDPPPALIVHGASAVLTSAGGRRVVAVEDLFLDYFETDLQPGEVMTSVTIPILPQGAGTAYLKFMPRTADDYATVSVAAMVLPGEGGVCQDSRIVLGSVGVTPIRATAAEAYLQGKPLNDENIAASAALVKNAVDPLDDFRGSAEYKTDMAEVFTRRALSQALANSSAG